MIAKVFFKLAISFALIANQTLSCPENCLSCNPTPPHNNYCIVCDTDRYYHVNEFGQCELNSIKFCKEQIDNECKKCDSDKYLKNGICVDFDELTIPDCELQIDQKCVECNSDSYPQNDNLNCVQFSEEDTRIENCHHYDEHKKCKKCEGNFSLILNQCIQYNENIQNCEYQSVLDCHQCSTGFFHYGDGFSYSVERSFYSEKSFLEESSRIVEEKYKYENLLCVGEIMQNCKFYNTYQGCLICEENYFPLEGICTNQPRPSDINCRRYRSVDQNGNGIDCLQCIENHFWSQDEEICKEIVESIPGCEVHSDLVDANQNSLICEKCEEGFLLNETKQCQSLEIIEVPENCSQHHDVFNFCLECNDGFALSVDKSECQSFQNCDIFEMSDISDPEQTNLCVQCKEGHQLIDNICQELPENCKMMKIEIIDDTEVKICEECNEEFALFENICVIHLKNENCLQQSLNSDDCEMCEVNFLEYKPLQKCTEIENDENCAGYDYHQRCIRCVDNFNLNGTICEELEADSICINKIGEDCKKCNEDHFLHEGNCIKIHPQVKQNCNEFQVKNRIVVCKNCQNSTPFVFQNFYICTPDDLKFDRIEGCAQQKQNQCEICAESKVLSNDKSMCVDNCDEGEVKVFGTLNFEGEEAISFNERAQCIKIDDQSKLNSFFEGCETASVEIQDLTTIRCTSCKDSFYPVELEQVCDFSKFTYFGTSITSDTIAQAHQPIKCEKIETPMFLSDREDNEPNAADELVSEPLQEDAAEENSPIERNLLEDIPQEETLEENLKNNCQIFKFENGHLLCQQCKHGYSGIIKSTDVINEDKTITYIEKCEEIEFCKKDSMYNDGGWDFEYINDLYRVSPVSHFNCKECDGNKIPFLQINFKGEIEPYGLNEGVLIPKNDENQNGKMVECREYSSEGLNIKESTHFIPVENCAQGVIFVDKDINFAEGLFVTCARCKNGFKPIIGDNGLINQCEEIQNCNLSSENQWFNACFQCNYGFVHPFENNQPQFERCEKIVTEATLNDETYLENSEAYRFYEINSDEETQLQQDEANSRHLLKPDFSLNLNGISLPSIECQENRLNQFNFSITKDSPIIMKILKLITEIFNQGCKKCEEGVSLYQETISLCLTSDTFDEFQANPEIEDENYVRNCQSYKLNNLEDQVPFYTCDQCTEETIPYTIDGKMYCKIKGQEGNCSVFEEEICTKCDEGFYFDEQNCSRISIENCQTQEGEMCTYCKNKYYLKDGQCYKGEISYCENYENAQKCGQCEIGKILIKIDEQNEDRVICVKNPIENCLQGSFTLNDSFECTKCQEDYYLNVEDDVVPLTQCFRVLEKSPCVEINNQILKEQFIANEYNNICQKCEQSHYQENGICKLRKNVTIIQESGEEKDVCEFYNEIEDACMKCQNNYAVKEGKCVRFSPGIIGCLNQTDFENCHLCSDLYKRVVVDNKFICQEINTDNRVEFCINYGDEETCTQCQSGRKLELQDDTQQLLCVERSDQNCQSWNDDQCILCKEHPNSQTEHKFFYRTLENQQIVCKEHEIPNCVDAVNNLTAFKVDEEFRNLRCAKCETDFYLNNQKQCESIEESQRIEKCQIYGKNQENQLICLSCSERNYIFNNETRACEFDEYSLQRIRTDQCQDMRKEDQWCTKCSSGYFYQFGNGDCRPCSIANCDKCIAEQPDVCLVCMSGYTMKGQRCFINIQPQMSGIEAQLNKNSIFVSGVGNLLTSFLMIFLLF